VEALDYGRARARVPAWPWVLIVCALACAIAAVTLSYRGPQMQAVSHLLAVAYGLLAAGAVLGTSTERAQREVSRRPYFLMAGIGTAAVLVGQSIGYLATIGQDGPFDPRVELLPLLVAMPVVAAATALLTWPRGLRGTELLLVAIDSALGIGALAVIWLTIVIPDWAPPADPAMVAFNEIDQWLLFVGIAVVVVLMAASRRLGSLPLAQLLLLLGGVLLWLVSDVFGEFGADRVVQITPSIIGYTLSVALLMAMGVRSAAETEAPWQTRWRYGLSLLLPVVLLLVAGLTVVGHAASNLGVVGVVAAGVGWLGLLAGLSVARLLSLSDVRRVQNDAMVQSLSESASHGWVGTLMRDTAEYVLVLDGSGNIVFASPRSRQDLHETARLADLVLEPDAAHIDTLLAGVTLGSIAPGPHDMLLRDQADGHREVEVHIRAVQDISFEGFVVTGIDVTTARRLARSLDRTRRRDELTGLLSEEAMVAEVAAALSATAANRTSLLFAVLDLSDFGVWNDTLGRSGGDDILRTVARQFEGLPAEVVAVSRQAGDSFGLLLSSATVATAFERVIDILQRGFAGMILPNDIEVEVGFRIGYSVATPGEVMDPGQLMEQAGVALRRARKSRQARVVRFQPRMNEDLVNRLAAELRIREALHHGGIVVYYQPIVSLEDGSVTSVEALARIRTENAGIIGPDHFMGAAEYSGLVKDIDRQVRERVAADWPVIAAETGAQLRININVSQKGLSPDLAAELRETDLTRRVVVEVTEASFLIDPQSARETLEGIRRDGGVVAIDDFGTGYSSLSQIVRLPCDVLKIDRSFIADMSETSVTARLVRAMIQLADDLGLKTVAEGVETGEQAAILRAIGCDRGQGFHYAKPLPLDELVPWIRSHRSATRYARLAGPHSRT
jgi:diguanylate cyclase (GGDEF)-like protein